MSEPQALANRTELFREVFRNHPAGAVLVTADAGSGPVAMTATSVCSVNADPPLMIFSASHMSSSTPTLRIASTVVVHMLDSSSVHLAKLGSTSGIDRFADKSMWRRLPTGEPQFLDASRWLRGRVVDRMEAPGATVFLVEALEIETSEKADEASALIYHNRSWHGIGDHSVLAP